ncbi:hypothetical protein HDU98_009607 [Podochytrium sp. JEL0797]|nr:hypothetical protein HDU98_009607 [Podochytrium sp. JEL0797]
MNINHRLALLLSSVLATLFLFLLLLHLPDPAATKFSTSTSQAPNSQAHRTEKKFPNIAIALKTGSETAASRAMAQVVTFLSEAQNVLVIGDTTGIRIGDIEVQDALTEVFEHAGGRLVKERIANGGGDGSETVSEILRREDRVASSGIGQKGWEMDAHKFLPGFQMLYSRFPDSEWFIMIDDDAYVFLENYSTFLKTLNPKKPYYIGQGNIFAGCGGVQNFGDGPTFAHGGVGIVVSRGAMKMMADIVNQCIMEYQECPAGDVRVGLCMRDAGVLMSGTDGLYQAPPNADFTYPDNACERPKVFHKVLPHQMQALFDTQQSSSGTMGGVFYNYHFRNPPSRVSGGAQELRMRNNTGVVGREMKSKEMKSVEACLAFCESVKQCVAWVMNGTTCHLKRGPGRFEENDGD